MFLQYLHGMPSGAWELAPVANLSLCYTPTICAKHLLTNLCFHCFDQHSVNVCQTQILMFEKRKHIYVIHQSNGKYLGFWTFAKCLFIANPFCSLYLSNILYFVKCLPPWSNSWYPCIKTFSTEPCTLLNKPWVNQGAGLILNEINQIMMMEYLCRTSTH